MAFRSTQKQTWGSDGLYFILSSSDGTGVRPHPSQNLQAKTAFHPEPHVEPAVMSEPQLGTHPLAIPQGKGSNKGSGGSVGDRVTRCTPGGNGDGRKPEEH